MKKKKILTVVILLLGIFGGVGLGNRYAVAEQNSSQTRVIIGTDNRTQVMDTTEPPYNSIAFIAADGSAGSGAVIGENTILTAAHVVNRVRDTPEKESVYVIPARSGSKIPYGKFKVSQIHIFPKYLENNFLSNDMALMIIEPLNGKSIGEVVPPLKFNVVNNLPVNTIMSTAGYPGDKPWGTMWESLGKATFVDNYFIEHNMSTVGGQSGSPVFNTTNEILGVHVGAPRTNFNTAAKINKEKYDFILNHLQ
ncbi:trypsin-like serine protease [Enterococcus mundtii]|uniref:trypsin-like serine peptidase n=1 Tax=Enterococcus mundtii TaxID=53346 RepID=UPI00101F2F19|nr:serine protease [Enterococcus mundtii]MZU11665.1 trypsin-like serine protease [Bifidobacterium longum]MZZ59982.1 trypsin-like serine protease [Enterococcus mundtii]MZZ62986.1 trypsin-like serine protease [Enterococcus mundtii]MZZ69994.1 trypsin-like serine protease [Enterococcus mundtii]MZZ98846.1 trypsin-like serine protease [Enterococcus mundtii]